MKDAKGALKQAVSQIPGEIRGRFASNAKLTDDDRNAVLEITSKAIESFLPQPSPNPSAKP
jgi:F-type H+-transporting ATPase subunit alpha